MTSWWKRMDVTVARRTLLLAAALAAIGAAAGPARASLMIALDLKDLVQRSQHIAVADVVSVQSAWDAKHERILSTITLNVVEAWKGSTAPATRLTVVQPGGTVDDISMVVFGMSQFRPGERALLFLRGTPAGAAVVGMAQGKRALTRDAVTGRWMVEGPDRSGVQLVRPATPAGGAKGLAAAAIEDALRRRPLDDLRQDVQDLMKATAR